jgi:EAL domain-containing protein (putative c-di-GMP-specific phosphodiesterase class I)
MYHAKAMGRDNYQFYSPVMKSKAFEQIALEDSLRRAIEQEEFVVHYQPLVCMFTKRITGMEALVRWNHPKQGLLYPSQFMRLAEDTGLILQLGEWVLRSACSQSRVWRESGFKDMRVAVNLSGLQFRHSNLVEMVTSVLSETGTDPGLLDLEVTENIVMQNMEMTILKFFELNEIGVQFSIDDFGTGYSSLSSLKKLPVQNIKIDNSFIQSLSDKPDNAIIVNAMIDMARRLNLKTIAEGVETEKQFAFLKENKCDRAQGYLFSPPLPPQDFESLLMSNKTF